MKDTDKQVKINEWETWQDVVEVRKSIPLPIHSGGKVIRLQKLLILEGGFQVSPDNPNIEVRRKPRSEKSGRVLPF